MLKPVCELALQYVHVAQRLAEQLQKEGHRVLYANQWDNPANRRAHIEVRHSPNVLSSATIIIFFRSDRRVAVDGA